MRRRVVLLLSSLALAAAGLLTVPAPAQAGGFCSVEEGCSPCPFGVVIAGKNTHIEYSQC